MKIMVKRTTEGCPTQWEGENDKGEDVYIRYQWGHLILSVNNSVVDNWVCGTSYSGVMSDKEMIKILSTDPETHYEIEIGF